MGCEPQDFHPAGAPLSRRVLPRGHADFLSYFQALQTAFPPLARRYLLAKYDDCVSDLYTPQQMIAALDKDPSRTDRLIGGRRDYLALKDTFGGVTGARRQQNQAKHQADHDAAMHDGPALKRPAHVHVIV